MGLADGLTICLSLAFAAEFFSSSSSRFTESDFCSSSTCSTVSLIFWRPMFRWSCCSSKSERFSLYNLACCGQIRIYSHVLFYILSAAELIIYIYVIQFCKWCKILFSTPPIMYKKRRILFILIIYKCIVHVNLQPYLNLQTYKVVDEVQVVSGSYWGDSASSL